MWARLSLGSHGILLYRNHPADCQVWILRQRSRSLFRHAHPSTLPWCISELLACSRMPVAAFHNTVASIQTECLPPARKGVIAAGQVMPSTKPSIMQHQPLPYGAVDACGWLGPHQRIQLVDDRAFKIFILMLAGWQVCDPSAVAAGTWSRPSFAGLAPCPHVHPTATLWRSCNAEPYALYATTAGAQSPMGLSHRPGWALPQGIPLTPSPQYPFVRFERFTQNFC